MKRVFIVCCLIFSSAYLFAQNDSIAIRNAMNAQVKAWNEGNIDAFMRTYWQSDSLLFISTIAPAYGWKTTLEHYKKNYPDTATMGKLSFNLINIKPLLPEFYFVVGEWHLIRSVGNIGGYFTLLFRKINNKWVIVVDHTS